MSKKKKIIIVIVLVIFIITALWFSGLIPMGIARAYSSIYMKKHYPDKELKYENIEWSRGVGSYIISFVDKDNQKYSICIGPKYFPVSFGQGIFELEDGE